MDPKPAIMNDESRLKGVRIFIGYDTEKKSAKVKKEKTVSKIEK